MSLSPWVVHKFGGSSVADADCFRRVADILEAQPAARLGVVLSACKGVTDSLLGLVAQAEKQDVGYLAGLDGLLVTGGAFDVDPALWGGGPPHPKVTLKPGRTDFEMAAVRAALAADKPVLGICGGQQLLAVAFGGTLIQHIPDEVAGALAHEQPNPRTEPGHEVAVAPGTLLSRIVGAPRMAVNSAHHQAVATAGTGAVVNAVAPDGVVEGVEHPGHRFALGVQWHPEYGVDPRDPAIFAAFVEACR